MLLGLVGVSGVGKTYFKEKILWKPTIDIIRNSTIALHINFIWEILN